MVLANNL